MTIGEQLRNARRARGITIEQLASVTKISPGVLRALEADDLAKLPGWVFTRGFLKAYAREVGLDPHETVVAFLAQITPPEEEDEGDTRKSRDSADTRSLATEHSTDLGQMIAVAVIVIAVVAYLGLHKRSMASAQASAPTVSSEPAPAAPAAEAPVATAGVATPMPVASESSDLKAELTATGPCWVAATADAELRMQRLMNAGDHETVAARETLTLRVGDPAALTFSLNGAAGRSLGEPGQPVTVKITRQNYRDYLAR